MRVSELYLFAKFHSRTLHGCFSVYALTLKSEKQDVEQEEETDDNANETTFADLLCLDVRKRNKNVDGRKRNK